MQDKEYLNAVDTVCKGCAFRGQPCLTCSVSKMAKFHKTMPQDKEGDLPVFMISFCAYGRLALAAKDGVKALENFEKPKIQEHAWNELKAEGITVTNITKADQKVARVDLPEHIQ